MILCFFYSSEWLFLSWGLKNNVDYIAASFIRKASDVLEIQEFCKKTIKEMDLKNTTIPLIISKIESTQGLQNFDEILAISDGIMVARGDLAVEIPPETLTACQKYIVNECNKSGKPVIVATQMLESMIKSPRPTRAEITDVSNAILDGTDCVMLSGESAKGRYPVESIAMMRRIIQETEKNITNKAVSLIYSQESFINSLSSSSSASAKTAASILQTIQSKKDFSSESVSGIIVNLEKEENRIEIAKILSKCKLFVPIFFPVSSYKQSRLLTFYQSLYPIVVSSSSSTTSQKLIDQIRLRFDNEPFEVKKEESSSFKKKQFLVVNEKNNSLSYEML
jgi:pyruvate kinase